MIEVNIPAEIVKPIIYVPMSEFQFVEYANIRYIEKKAEKGGSSWKNESTRQASQSSNN